MTVKSPPAFTLCTLGGVSLATEQGPVDGPLTQRRRLALLAILACGGERGVSRDKVVGYLWPESTGDKARHTLAQWLFLLRRDLGAADAVLGTTELRLNPERVWSDVAAFTTALAQGRPDEAVAVYAGAFLDGFHLNGAPEFARWADEERVRLGALYRSALERVAAERAAAGDAPAAAHAWQRRAAADPHCARTACALMRALDAAGDRPAALAHARVYDALVRDELDDDPDPAVAALAVALRAAPPTALPAGPAPSPPELRPTPPEAAPALPASPAPAAPAAPSMAFEGRGVQEAAPRRLGYRSLRRALAGGVLAALLAAIAVAAAGLAPRSSRAVVRTLLTRGPAAVDPRRVVVAPLENRTQDARLDAFGEMAADWITQALGHVDEFEVVDARTAAMTARVVERIPRVLRPGDRAVALAQETGAGTVVSGRYYAERDTVRVYVQLTDVATGRVRRSIGPVTGPVTALSALVDRVGRGAAAHAAAAVDTSAAGLGIGRSAPPSYEAYRETSRAWGRYYVADFPGALAHATRAAAFDSTYMLPLLMRAFFHADLRQWPAVDSLVRRVALHEARLSPLESAAYEMLRADLAGDLEGELRAAQELRRLTPVSAEAGTHVAHLAVLVNRPRLALAALAPLDPKRGVLLVIPFYWNWRTAALHELGDHAAELVATEHQLRQFPTRSMSVLNRARALATVGRADDIRALADRAGDERWPADAVRRRALVEGSRELRAHGYPEPARALLARALATLPTEDATLEAAEERALLLAEAERWGEARALLERVLARAPERATARGGLGVVAARLGDRAEAARALAVLGADVPGAFSRGRRTMWRARIAAALGDGARAVSLVRQALGEGYPVLQGYAGLPGEPRGFDYAEPSVHADPALAPLVGDAAFRRILTPRL